jgi:hypothetical protein
MACIKAPEPRASVARGCRNSHKKMEYNSKPDFIITCLSSSIWVIGGLGKNKTGPGYSRITSTGILMFNLFEENGQGFDFVSDLDVTPQLTLRYMSCHCNKC